MNFAFYVSNKATRLVKFLKSCPLSVKSFQLVLHNGIENDELIGLCKKHEIKYEHIDFLNVEGKSIYFSDTILMFLLQNKIDIVFSFGDKILKGKLLSIYENKIINFHPSILPAFSGLNAIDRALDSSCLLLGNTAHFIDEGVDTGTIIMQSFILKQKYSKYDDVLDMQIPMLNQLIDWITTKRLYFEKNSVHIKGAKYNLSNFIPNLEFEVEDFYA